MVGFARDNEYVHGASTAVQSVWALQLDNDARGEEHNHAYSVSAGTYFRFL